MQSVGLPKWSSTQIRGQEVHSNGVILDDILLSDPEVCIALNFFLELSSLNIGGFNFLETCSVVLLLQSQKHNLA